ncbi:MAG TPA: phage baseplate assembly protein V [Candidatus Binatia bacterium]|nr:phage baseplate assembly protein V [Candidatus Binatia bacterium]
MNLPEGHRETSLEEGGVVRGVATAKVTQNKDDEGQCRVKVRYPWHENPRDSYWARLAMPMAGDGRGLVMIPEVGDEVVVAFEREDIRFPVVLGALYGKDKPPVANDDGKNDKRILKSRKRHYLVFDDGSRGAVTLAHEKGRQITFDDDGIVVKDENGNQIKIESTSGAMTIEAKGQLNIKGTTVTIESSSTMEIKASATLTVRGALVNIN